MRAPGTILPLEARGLGFAAGSLRILSGIDLTIAGGAPTVILGPNGAGKSTLLRLLHGLLAPTEGEVRWAGAGANFPVDAFARRCLLDGVDELGFLLAMDAKIAAHEAKP